METFLNTVLQRGRRAERVAGKLMASIESESAEAFLKLLLKLMGLAFMLDKSFRRNIEDFSAGYQFRSRVDGSVVSAVFAGGKLKVGGREIKNKDVTVIFRNGGALRNYLLSPKPDILGALLRQDIVIHGNLNYLYKLAYMAKHLQLKMTGAE